MIVLTRGLRRAGIAVATALTVAVAAPAAAQAAGCPAQPLAQTFQPWLDPAWYVPAPDGGLEADGAGWTLAGGAAVVDGNEPFFVGAAGDRRSLALPPGASATTAAMCIGVEHPTIRFFARNTGSPLATLAVSVVFRDVQGGRQSLPIGLIAGGPVFAPTAVVPVVVNLLSLAGDQQVSFQFAPSDDGGEWTIDDVYVDPYSKG